MKRRILTPYSVQTKQRGSGLIGSNNSSGYLRTLQDPVIRTPRQWSNGVMAGLLAVGLSAAVARSAAAQTAEPTDRFRILSGPPPTAGAPVAGAPGSACRGRTGSACRGRTGNAWRERTGTPAASGQGTPAAIWLMLDSQTGKSWQLACGVGAVNPVGSSAPPTSSFGSSTPCVLEWFPLAHSPRTPLPARRRSQRQHDQQANRTQLWRAP